MKPAGAGHLDCYSGLHSILGGEQLEIGDSVEHMSFLHLNFNLVYCVQRFRKSCRLALI